jgi:60 kDa SS-A/Ro ribonucleoprotein
LVGEGDARPAGGPRATELGGQGGCLRRAVGRWYTDRDADALAFQLVKYQQREGWSHCDLPRLSKPTPERDSPTDATWRCDGLWGKLDGEMPDQAPALLRTHRLAQDAATPAETARLIETNGLPWEAVTARHLSSPEVWNALLPSIGLGALARNLARMTVNASRCC